MPALPTTSRPIAADPETSAPLERMYAAIRAVTRVPADWQTVVDAVVADLSGQLPPVDDVLRAVAAARRGSDRSQLLHVEPDGSFSVVALVFRPGQATSVHDHTTWGVVRCLVLTGTRTDRPGTVSGFAPPGDIHRATSSEPPRRSDR